MAVHDPHQTIGWAGEECHNHEFEWIICLRFETAVSHDTHSARLENLAAGTGGNSDVVRARYIIFAFDFFAAAVYEVIQLESYLIEGIG